MSDIATSQDLSQLIEQVDDAGYVIIPNLIERDVALDLRDQLRALMGPTGRNEFEGFSTQRVYGVLARTLICNPLVEHPTVLALLDHYVRDALLSQMVAINIQPNESTQGLHHDDALYPIPRPRDAISAATMWALDDFTEANGATRIIPNSHSWSDGLAEGAEASIVAAEMPAGSVMFYLGTTWHEGGANSSNAPRMGFTVQYCAPWCRPVENFGLSTPLKTVAKCSERLREMLGFSIHSNLMGYVDGRHPKRLLEGLDR